MAPKALIKVLLDLVWRLERDDVRDELMFELS